MTVLENVTCAPRLADRGTNEEITRRAKELLDQVGLADKANEHPIRLSGGQQQRVAIARALAPEPRILIADEPTGNLDQATGRQVADLLFAKARERGMTLVLVTHDAALASRCARQVSMRSGRIEATPLVAVSA
jgi:putative ABC transport system ATP-binding protein